MTDKLICRFTIHGAAQPAGSKRAMAIYRKGAAGREIVTRANGSPVIAVVDDCKKSRSWKNQVSAMAIEAMETGRDGGFNKPVEGPLKVEFVFFRTRPKNHFGSGRNSSTIKPSSPVFPTTKPDLLKLARGVEDAMTQIVYGDDSQIVVEVLSKRWGSAPCCEVTVWQIEETRPPEPKLF